MLTETEQLFPGTKSVVKNIQDASQAFSPGGWRAESSAFIIIIIMYLLADCETLRLITLCYLLETLFGKLENRII